MPHDLARDESDVRRVGAGELFVSAWARLQSVANTLGQLAQLSREQVGFCGKSVHATQGRLLRLTLGPTEPLHRGPRRRTEQLSPVRLSGALQALRCRPRSLASPLPAPTHRARRHSAAWLQRTPPTALRTSLWTHPRRRRRRGRRARQTMVGLMWPA